MFRLFALLVVAAAAAPEDQLAKEMTHDLEMNFNKQGPQMMRTCDFVFAHTCKHFLGTTW